MSDIVWGLDTGRSGEYMQVVTLGESLGMDFQRVRVSPQGEVLDPLPVESPRLILSFGKAARTALRLAAACTPRPLLVHLGTPGQTRITAFDLIIPMPQDDYPVAPNVLQIRLPLNGASMASSVLPACSSAGICTVIVGGPSRHFRLPWRAMASLVRSGGRLATANAEALRVVTSPRTPLPVLTELRRLSTTGGFTLQEFGDTPFSGILQSASRFLVTADSASMLAEACRTGAPVWLFKLPARPNLSDFLQHAADSCCGPGLRHGLVRRGWIGGGTDFRRWHARLEQDGTIAAMPPAREAALRWSPTGLRPDTDLRECRGRILGMLSGPENPSAREIP